MASKSRGGRRRSAPGRKAAAGKARKGSARKATRKPAAGRAAGAAAKPRPAAAKAGGSPLADLARRIVRATTGQGELDWRDLYAPTATSREAAGDTVTGYAGLQEKIDRWNQMQDPTRTRWKARKVATGNGTIFIEWEGRVHLRDGRVVDFSEAAVHEVKDGKIVAERYYYNPAAFAPPQP
jgi:ketosteroid isomerase-like protein